MRAICFIQEVKSGDLTMQQQILICRKALRKLRWPCVQELYAQAGTEDQPLTLRPGMMELLRAVADGEADVLIVVDANHLYCGRPELEGLLASLLQYDVHTFGVIWRRMIWKFDARGFDFQSVQLSGIQPELYSVYQAAKAISTGSRNITLADLASPELVTDEAFHLIVCALLLAKYGDAILNFEGKYSEASVDHNGHLHGQRVNHGLAALGSP